MDECNQYTALVKWRQTKAQIFGENRIWESLSPNINPTWTMKAGLHDKKPIVLGSTIIGSGTVEVGIVVDRSENSVQFTGYKVPTLADRSSRGVLPRKRNCVCVCVCLYVFLWTWSSATINYTPTGYQHKSSGSPKTIALFIPMNEIKIRNYLHYIDNIYKFSGDLYYLLYSLARAIKIKYK
jgi:hypothetical protein